MIKLKDLIVENKSDKKTFDKIVKALKGIPVRATIHLDDEDKISIALGYDYYRKKNPEGTGDLGDMIEDRLKKAGIQKGYNSPPGVSIMADSSVIGDKKYNSQKDNKSINKNLMLHSYQIKFRINEKKYTYRASLPEYFKKMLKTKRLNFQDNLID